MSQRATVDTFKQKLLASTKDREKRRSYERAIDDVVALNEERFAAQGKFLGNFTSHGPDHSDRMLKHVLDLLPVLKRTKTSLTDRELFILGLSVYMHDLGMTVPLSPRDYDRCKNDDERWILRRKRHADAIEDVVLHEAGTSLAFLREAETTLFDEFLVDLCKAHSNKNFGPSSDRFKAYAHHDPEVRYTMLAGLLMLVDELDISRDRTPMNYEFYPEFGVVTKAHWWKHWLVDKCYVDESVIRVVHVPTTSKLEAAAFSSWTSGKLKSQIDFLRREVDTMNNGPFSKLVLEIEDTGRLVGKDLPRLDLAVVDVAKFETRRLSDPIVFSQPVKHPCRSIANRVARPNEMVNPSDAYIKLIQPHAPILRGMGFYAPIDSVLASYVEVEANEQLRAQLTAELADLLSKRRSLPEHPLGGDPHRETPTSPIRHARRAYTVVGDVGVGKTHFLSVFGELFKQEHADLFKRTLMVRCEMTECKNLLDVHRRVAGSVLEELSRVVGLDMLRSAASNKHIGLRVPSAIDLRQMLLDEVDQFIETIGVLVDAADTPELLGDRAPIGMCLFMDNSDQLDDDLVAQIDQWAYDLGSKGVTATMVFFRPSTFSRIIAARQVQSDHLTNRLPFGVVVSPPLVDVLQRRIELLFEEVGSNATTVTISDMPSEFGAQVTVAKLETAFKNIVKSLSATAGALLPSFAGSNVRRTLQSFDWIVGSWVMDSGALFTAITTGKQLPSEGGQSGWPRLLESFMLGPRRWYVPDFSPVESLFHPPSVDATGDHLIAIHLMQIIEQGGKRGLTGSRDKRMTLGRLLDAAREAHYSIPRVLHVLHWLADHESRDDEGASLFRATPLIATSSQGIQQGGGLEEPHDLDCQLRNTKWGDYHLRTLIYQLRYWKHIYYDLVLPQETEANLLGHDEGITGEFLFRNLKVVVDFLTSYEDDWLRDVPIAPSIGIVPVMPRVSETLQKQMARGQSRP